MTCLRSSSKRECNISYLLQVIARDTLGRGKKSGGAPQRGSEEHPIIFGSRLAPGSQDRGEQTSSPTRHGPSALPDLQKASRIADGLAGDVFEKGRSNNMCLSCVPFPSMHAFESGLRDQKSKFFGRIARVCLISYTRSSLVNEGTFSIPTFSIALVKSR